MAQIENFYSRYPEISHIKEYVRIYPNGNVQIDGFLKSSELRELAEFLDKLVLDFGKWYGRLKELPGVPEEALNISWHHFVAGKSVEESYKQSKQYFRE